LDGYDDNVYYYEIDHDTHKGYSVRCYTEDKIDYVNFYYDGGSHTEYNEPWFMSRNDDHRYNRVDYLETCGYKEFTIRGYIEKKDNDYLCFEKHYEFEAGCDDFCPKGKKLVSGYCVDKSCKDDYACPRFSERKPDRDCYNNFDDCYCKSGYHKEGDECVKNNGRNRGDRSTGK